MRRVVVDRSEAEARLSIEEVPVPQPLDQQLLVGVRFAGLNLKDVKQLAGAQTASAVGVDRPGIEVAGHVLGVGRGVEGFDIGDPVVARVDGGGFADAVLASPSASVRLPRRVTDDQLAAAARSLVALTTAVILLEELGRVRAGDSLLVHGAAGAVGSALGLLAQRLELTPVLGTVGAAWKAEAARSCGYDEVFLRSTFLEEVMQATGGRGVDHVADPIGGEVRRQSFDALAPLGRLLAFGRTGTTDEGDIGGFAYRSRCLSFQGMTNGTLADRAPQVLARAAQRAVSFVLEGPGIPEHVRLPLSRIDEAYGLLGGRTTVGKVLIAVADDV